MNTQEKEQQTQTIQTQIEQENKQDLFESTSHVESIMQQTNGEFHDIIPMQLGQTTMRLEATGTTHISSIIEHYHSNLSQWTSFSKFTEIYKANKREMSKNTFYNIISGKSNLLFLFTTSNLCSFGVFESREIPESPEEMTKINYSNGVGKHFIFSLDNPIEEPFKVERKTRFFLFDWFDNKPFFGLYSRKDEDTLFEIKNFLVVTTNSCGAFLDQRYHDQYNDSSSEGLERFEPLRGRNVIYFDHFMVYQCEN